ncbi:YbaK/EbsC family protein (plasmid) [Peteryoungia desertarenae]|uniref:YbaK/EbsC family protein n=1 Tax=Peteryoungia desertarenae TaxID=1813451 RepID=A0ABX6QUA6_9HYPH|nr:YbaK/EbsC family protein [Peteryoungia desertarenae]QLF71775.1 YbaK/EbsC family protein [Peteryoungia desertarenae]
MSKSVRRVEAAAEAHGLVIAVKRMGETTRTAEDAARACGCTVDRIVKSLVFRGARSGDLHLLLVSGAERVDVAKAEVAVGEPLERAEADEVRARTGFAIGGVSPLGHLQPPVIWMDARLLDHETVWAAAGAPDAVFEVAPLTLATAINARTATLY